MPKQPKEEEEILEDEPSVEIIKPEKNTKSEIEYIPTDEIIINETYRNLVPEISDDRYTNLKSDIKKYGMLNPITLNVDNEIIDGHNRYKIANELNFKIVPIIVREYKNEFEEQREIISLNLNRRQLKKNDLLRIAGKLLPIEEELAKIRLEATLPEKGVKGTSKLEEDSIKGEAIEIVAGATGLGRTTVDKIKKIIKKAEDDPEVAEKWEKAIEKGSVDGLYKELFPEPPAEEKDKPKDKKEIDKTPYDFIEIDLQRRTVDNLYLIMDNIKRPKRKNEEPRLFYSLDEIIEHLIRKSNIIKYDAVVKPIETEEKED